MEKTSDFKKGDKVRYVPNHANGNIHHPRCKDGVVSSHNPLFVFVKYYHTLANGIKWPPIETGDEPYTAAATKVENLVRI